MKTYVHYMPWFENKESSDNGLWGIHWTMANKNPDNIDENGKQEIASHFYPLTGPYASSDPDIIEYQLLLMKYSGIEGVLIDWYGSSDLNDYPLIRRNAEALINALDLVGLKFAIIYEDRTISARISKDPSFDRIAGAQEDMSYISANYFSKSSYIQIDNRPLLMLFGPEEFHLPAEWTEIFSVFPDPKPCFLVLTGKTKETGANSSGEYIWVDPSSLAAKYATMSKFSAFMGGAFPGFKDFYGQGGWGSNFPWQIDYKDGETFTQNLQIAKNANVKSVQLITWNDYGEGTMIEPTQEFEYNLLGSVQQFAGVTYTQDDLKTIFDQYELRKKYPNDSHIQDLLDQSFYYFVSLQTTKAQALTDSLKNL
jgi:hypothetical protein